MDEDEDTAVGLDDGVPRRRSLSVGLEFLFSFALLKWLAGRR
jgi:hypothetical protein